MSKVDYFRELNYRLRGLPEKERQNILSVYEELFQKAVENGKHEDEVAQSLGYPRVPNWDGPKEAKEANEGKESREPKEPPFVKPETPKKTVQEPLPPLEKTFPRPEAAPMPKQAEEGLGFPPYTPPQPQSQPNPYYNQHPPYPYPVKQETGIKAIIVSIALGFFNLLFVVGPWFGILATLIALFVSGFALIVAPIAGMLGSFMGTVGNDLRFIGFAMLSCFGLGVILTTLSTWMLKAFFKLSWSYIRFNAKLIKGA